MVSFGPRLKQTVSSPPEIRELDALRRRVLGAIYDAVGGDTDIRISIFEATESIRLPREDLNKILQYLYDKKLINSPAIKAVDVQVSISREGADEIEEAMRVVGPTKIHDRPQSLSENKSHKKWDVFICHASEDKRDFVKPLARALGEKFSVWFDEYELKWGDSLRAKIDEGLANSRFGIVVLSQKFFEKHWTKEELDGLAVRAEIEGRNIILPIWYGLDKAQVAKNSLLLAGKLALKAADGIPKIVLEFERLIGKETTNTLPADLDLNSSAEPSSTQSAARFPGWFHEFPDIFGPYYLQFLAIVRGTQKSKAPLSSVNLIIDWQHIYDTPEKDGLVWVFDEAVAHKLLSPTDSKQAITIKTTTGQKHETTYIKCQLTSRGIIAEELFVLKEKLKDATSKLEETIKHYEHWNTGHKMEVGSEKEREISSALEVARTRWQLARDAIDTAYRKYTNNQ